MKCLECKGSRDVHRVYLRHGWGRSKTEWDHESTPLCRPCRDELNGHWKYEDPDRRKRLF